MNEQTITPQTELSFKDFLFKNKRNRTILILAAVAIVVQFAIFKYLYPYASFIHGDSFSYIKAADQNLSINTYMIGYSKFLRLFSVFTKSDFALVSFQYLFIQCSTLFLLFTIFYLHKPGRVVQIVLLCFMVFNPLFLHLANLVSSDGFFLALSMTWFTLLLWIMHYPSKRVNIWHAVVLFVAFTVRYNAMIYPIISIGAFWLSKLPVRQKLIGIGAGILLCGLFICFTSYQYKRLTGYWQYSPFSGWQMANNAMYAYRYVDSTDRKSVPKKFEALDNTIRDYFDSTHDTNKFIIEKIQASTYYMWSDRLPLMKYRNDIFKNDTSSTELKKWSNMGPLYKGYGINIISKYPWHFIRYFMWPNANKYYAPPVEFLETYNSGSDFVTKETKKWFGYNNTNVNVRTKNKAVWILDFYPILSGVINIVMLFMILYYVVLKGWHYNRLFAKGLLLGSTLWFLNASFTIFASSAALRFQSFPIMITIIFACLLIDWMVQLMGWLKLETTNLNTSKKISQVSFISFLIKNKIKL